MDFGKADRNKVLQFVIDKYGQDRVASLGAFQYIWAKGAIKDIGRVLGIPFDITNEMTSQLENETINEVIELGLLDKYKERYPELFDYAKRLAGLPKSFGSHPCGKVAAMDDIVFYNAVDINDNGEVILQGDMHTAEDLGLIKADFLGLRTVDVIYDTLEMIGKDYDYIAPHNLKFDDEKIWENFRNGFTAGIFQFESSGMRDTLKKINCSSIEDLSVANALFRPGSIKFIDNYADRKKGIEEFEYLHPDLEKILSNTFGVIVFQEQLIEVGRLAKLSNPDELRKATAKKKADLLDKIKPELYKGLQNRGWTVGKLDKLWESMLDFAKYSFNKSHSAAYALIAYICMYLKTYHSKEFMCAWINSVSDKVEKITECAFEATRLGVPIYLGKFDNCSSSCVVHKDGVMIGTNTIKFCNAELANELMAISKEKKYDTFIDLLDAVTGRIDNRMLKIVTGLRFFSAYGENSYLLKVIDLYNGIKVKDPKTKKEKAVLPALRTVKQFSKDKIENYAEYGLTEYIIKKYAGKETAKQYSDIDNLGLLKELITRIENKPMSITDYIRFEKEYLGYTTYVNPSMPYSYYVVLDYRTNKDSTKPYFTLRSLSTGVETKTRIKQSKVYRQNPFGEYSVLKLDDFTWDYKKKLIGGEWKLSDEQEPIVEEYEVIKKS